MLVFEPQITGHRKEYLVHLMDFVCNNGLTEQYTFVTNADIHIPVQLKNNKRLKIEYISNKKSRSLLQGSILSRGLKYYYLAKKYAKQIDRSEFLFLWLNDVQLMLGLFGFPCPTSGILFKPYVRMEKKSLSSKFVWWRKWVQTWLLSKQKKVEKIWILDDEYAVNKLNKSFRTKKFVILHEPISCWDTELVYDVRKIFEIDSDKKLMVHLGTLSTRKGTIDILESLASIEEIIRSELVILIAGTPQMGMEEVIAKAVDIASRHNPDIQIVYYPEFMPNSVMQSIFEQCDGVLIPYQNTESSSGILSHAILNGKPVLGINKGLMGETIKKNDAGVLIDDVSPKNIAKGIIQMLQNTSWQTPTPAPADQDYLKIHNPKKFAEKLLIG